MNKKTIDNARDLEQELQWFVAVLNRRFKSYLGGEAEADNVFELSPPDLGNSSSEYAKFLRYYKFVFAERFAIVLALVSHIRPQLLDVFFTKNSTFDRKFTEFGGVRKGVDGDFYPTAETLLFILAGNHLETRFALQALFDRDHPFAKHHILRLQAENSEMPRLKAPLVLSEEHLSFFTTGHSPRPNFGANFPARHIETQLDWKDLVLHPGTRRQIEEIETWIRHGPTLMNEWAMASKLRPGYRALFYGAPGTGKTMTASVLGKATGREVYKVDLSLVVSKYIGETERLKYENGRPTKSSGKVSEVSRIC